MKILILILILINFKNLYSYEIIRDQIFESYLKETLKDITSDDKIDFRLINSLEENAFIINNNYIFITKGLFKNMDSVNSLISIILHEYAHIKKNHVFQKKIKINELNNYKNYINIFSIIAGLSTKNADIVFGSSLSLNETLIQDFLSHSREFENEADDEMLNYMNMIHLDTSPIINFIIHLGENITNNQYRQTHPSTKERVNKLKNNIQKNRNILKDKEFDFIKAKYFQNSNNKIYNDFFKNIKFGKFKVIEDDEMSIASKYELFKTGIIINNAVEIYEKNISSYNNSYVKLEYLNYLIDNNKKDMILNKINLFKIDKNVKNEFYFLFIMGKTYGYLNEMSLSNFYFCNFYKKVLDRELSNFYCNKYDNNMIENIDLINEINVNFN